MPGTRKRLGPSRFGFVSGLGLSPLCRFRGSLSAFYHTNQTDTEQAESCLWTRAPETHTTGFVADISAEINLCTHDGDATDEGAAAASHARGHRVSIAGGRPACCGPR